ncbi:hypothetical protein JFP838_05965 [Clostridium perfringens]|uniref:Uncharacterized protein n=2 Tax=Clostridium perfringens TaxID=1502 RepID=A0A140GUA4_CLOPF|nr:hypothetical protein JFP838_05965 [Clostridium perfringens]
MTIYIIRMFDINPNMLVEVDERSVVLSCGNSYVVKYFTGYPQVLKPEESNSYGVINVKTKLSQAAWLRILKLILSFIKSSNIICFNNNIT